MFKMCLLQDIFLFFSFCTLFRKQLHNSTDLLLFIFTVDSFGRISYMNLIYFSYIHHFPHIYLISSHFLWSFSPLRKISLLFRCVVPPFTPPSPLLIFLLQLCLLSPHPSLSPAYFPFIILVIPTCV